MLLDGGDRLRSRDTKQFRVNAPGFHIPIQCQQATGQSFQTKIVEPKRSRKGVSTALLSRNFSSRGLLRTARLQLSGCLFYAKHTAFMPRDPLTRIRKLVRELCYEVTDHAWDEMADDNLLL